MDISKLTHGAKVVLGSTIAFLVVSFFNWFSVNGTGVWTMWHGTGFIAGVLAIALLIWEAVHIAGMKVDLPLHPAVPGAVLGILIAIFAFLRFISTPGGSFGELAGIDRTIWAWLGLILAIAIAAGAVANAKQTGLTISEIKSQVSETAAAASAAASKSEGTTVQAEAAPAAPAAPAEPEAPAAPEPAAAPPAEAPQAAAAEPAAAVADEPAPAADEATGDEAPPTAPAS